MIDMKVAHARVRMIREEKNASFKDMEYKEVLRVVMRAMWKRLKALTVMKRNPQKGIERVVLVRQFVYGDTEQAAKKAGLSVMHQWMKAKYVSIHLEDVFDSWTEAAMKRKGYEPLKWNK